MNGQQDLSQLGTLGLVVYLVGKEVIGLVRLIISKQGKNGKTKFVTTELCEERTKNILSFVKRIDAQVTKLVDRGMIK